MINIDYHNMNESKYILGTRISVNNFIVMYRLKQFLNCIIIDVFFYIIFLYKSSNITIDTKNIQNPVLIKNIYKTCLISILRLCFYN